eukprot:2629074-Pyramimonas_sp.AAC.1
MSFVSLPHLEGSPHALWTPSGPPPDPLRTPSVTPYGTPPRLTRGRTRWRRVRCGLGCLRRSRRPLCRPSLGWT